jgi:hypothetical protein
MRKYISTAIVVGLLLVAMVFTAGCTSSDNTPTPSVPSATRDPTFVPKNISGYRTYSDRSVGISIQYPSSWQAKNGSGYEIVSFNVSGSPSMSFTVYTQDFSGTSTTLNDFSQSALPTNLTNFKLLNSTDTTLSGYPARKHVFTFMTFDGATAQGMLQLTLVNRTGYILLYVATQDVYPDYLGITQNMTQSFNVVK